LLQTVTRKQQSPERKKNSPCKINGVDQFERSDGRINGKLEMQKKKARTLRRHFSEVLVCKEGKRTRPMRGRKGWRGKERPVLPTGVRKQDSGR